MCEQNVTRPLREVCFLVMFHFALSDETLNVKAHAAGWGMAEQVSAIKTEPGITGVCTHRHREVLNDVEVCIVLLFDDLAKLSLKLC